MRFSQTTRMLISAGVGPLLCGLAVVFFAQAAAAQDGPRLVAPRVLRPSADARPVQRAAPPAEAGDLLAIEAYRLTRTAKGIEDYSEIIAMCEQANTEGVGRAASRYLPRLLSWAHNRRGQALAGEGSDAAALEDFEAAVAYEPDRWRSVHNRAVSYALLGRHEEALADFDRALGLNPAYANAWFNRAEVRTTLGRLDEAVGDYTRAIELAPGEAAFHTGRGRVLMARGDRAGAERDFTAALAQNPNFAPALTNRGDCYVERGAFAGALADYRAAVQIDPGLPHTHLSAAWLMATCPDPKIRNPQWALEAAQRALDLDGVERHRAFDVLAAAQANAGDYASARRSLQEALKLAPPEMADVYAARLALYGQNRPFRTGTQPAPRVARADQPTRRPASHRTGPTPAARPVRPATAIEPARQPAPARPRSARQPRPAAGPNAAPLTGGLSRKAAPVRTAPKRHAPQKPAPQWRPR